MKFEYCAIYYAVGTGQGDVNIPPSDSELSNQKFINEDALNVLGKLGWELISSMPVNGNVQKLYLIFKRAIPA